ncbi:hypothetical protein BD324DRAFT_625068 [Kockovaella imperatae]|uniref:Integral membrane protein n=1 Tax=Kockovaella imperatae TaxID=4999 RepID=A0A1Y1UJ88_9TREE|nr:hypothetical protein BD324DRAFT_625068 [Kockovaella imperatae]ORX37175.1 hypothetical protein BD324DRAFT_625068 [Kockovaella imperatae]
MSSRSTVTTLVVGMFVTGCANSLLTKYQDKACVENCGPNDTLPKVDFEQPVWQTLNMFIGELGCGLPLLYRCIVQATKRKDGKSFPGRVLAAWPGDGSASTEGYNQVAQDEGEVAPKPDFEERLTGWKVCLLWFPAFFDICGTTLMNVGMILCPVSIYQMSRGALVLWVGILSVIFLRRHLYLYQWTSLIIVTMGVCLVGLSGSMQKKPMADEPVDLVARFMEIAQRSDEDPGKVAVGVLLILFAQVFTASQFVVEEKIMARYKVEPVAAVTYEGFFGLVTTLAAMPILHLTLRHRSPYFDVPRGWRQIIHHPRVYWTCIAIMFSIGSFNFFGLSVTTRISATARSLIDTCRTLGIWIFSLAVGWERLIFPLSLLQVAGFAMLVYGTFVFNGLLKPLCFPPPAQVRLPQESDLEETGATPAASSQSRQGYDVLPSDEH